MALTTVVYYTANTEDPAFEARIRARLAAQVADAFLPLISVSREPLTFGENICVGATHPCDANAFRQLLIGARAARTPFVTVAEADCVYPPAYFSYVPPVVDCIYRYVSVWVLFGRHGFRKKEWTEGAQIVGRDVLIEALERVLFGRPEWSGPYDLKPGTIYKKRSWQYFGSDDEPMVSCKTGRGLRTFTGTVKGLDPVEHLPYWGLANDLRSELWGLQP